jgi:hypothetical protein
MLTEKEKQEILDNIENFGHVEQPVINKDINAVLSYSSGLPRLQRTFERKAVLTLSQPHELKSLNPFEIRCALCKRVISYPCWYYNAKYNVNSFHYFVCFSKESPNKPSLNCVTQ